MAPANTIQLQAIVSWPQGAMLLTMLLLDHHPPKKNILNTMYLQTYLFDVYI